jgi:hypothetical protein
MWKIEGSSRNGNTQIQNEECEMYLNAIENETMEKGEKNQVCKVKK